MEPRESIQVLGGGMGITEITGLTGIRIIVFVSGILTTIATVITGLAGLARPGAFADGHIVVVIGISFLTGVLTSGLTSGVLAFGVFTSSFELDTFGSDPGHVEGGGDNVYDGWTEFAVVIAVSCGHVGGDFSESADITRQ